MPWSVKASKFPFIGNCKDCYDSIFKEQKESWLLKEAQLK